MRPSVRIPALLITAAGAAFLAFKVGGARLSTATATATADLTALGRGITTMATTTTTTTTTTTVAATEAKAAPHRGAVVALSHGGGPLPLLGDPDSAALAQSLRTRVPAILGLDDAARRPKAIVLVTAHWSEGQPTISSGERHKLLYDYGGFPAAAYKLQYDAPGSPAVAARVAAVLREAGFAPRLDAQRGWDHGVFVPMLLVRPQADVPIVQVSVLASEDAAAHTAMGRALGRLRDEGVAVVGSGFASFHNLRLMFSGATRSPAMRTELAAWNGAVTAAAVTANATTRAAAFDDWRSWPAAYTAHPRGGAEHMLPLLVCAGAAGDEAGKTYVDDYMGLGIHSYYWE